MKVHEVKTSAVKLAYEESRSERRSSRVILVHGWPDSPRTWDKVLPVLHEAGYRTSRALPARLRAKRVPLAFFRPQASPHGPASRLCAGHVIDLADALKLKTFDFVGHDWGARTGLLRSPHCFRSGYRADGHDCISHSSPGPCKDTAATAGAGLLVPVVSVHGSGS